MKNLPNRRSALLDTVRGLTLCSMVAYHGIWDAVHLFGVRCAWYGGPIGTLWQQSICWTFLLLSGFCWPLGRRPVRQGLIVSAAGGLVTAISLVFSYDDRIIFGVLTLLGFMTLLLAWLDPLLRRVPPLVGTAASVAAFALLRSVNAGWLGWGSLRLLRLPQALYHGYCMTFLGFLDPNFYSSDYFSLLPWGFLVLTGYFAAHAFLQGSTQLPAAFRLGWQPLEFLGRHSLVLYLLHQPLLYVVLYFALR